MSLCSLRGMRALSVCLVFMALMALGWGQDTSTSSVSSGQSTVSTEVKSAEVVYVSGNDLVVKTDDGQLKHFVVPPDQTVTVGDQQLTVRDLKPGMRLTRTITTTHTPETVTTVRTIKGRVWHVTPPTTVVLTLPDGTNKQYKIPEGQLFNINGEERDAFHLRKGMTVSATVLTETPQSVSTTTTAVTGTPPPLPAPSAESALLVEVPSNQAEPQPAPEPARTPAPAANVAHSTLPQTASTLPLIGLLGVLCVGMSLLLRAHGS